MKIYSHRIAQPARGNWAGFFLLLAGLAVLFSQTANSQQLPPPGDEVEVKLPGNSINEVLNLYGMLTGKTMVRDANLAGPNLNVVIPGKVPRSVAIAMVESALLLNGYTLVPVDDSTVKVLGTAKDPRGEGIPLYTDPSSLPSGEQVVSYFMPLRYISAKDAVAVFENYVFLRPNGKWAIVPNANAIVITDNTPLIRRLINLQYVIDVPGSKILTEFVPLTRSNAEKVADLVNKIIGDDKERQDGKVPQLGTPQPADQSGAPDAGISSAAAQAAAMAASTTRVLADTRANRIVVVTAENRMAYIRKLIQDLDVAVILDPPLKWKLRFVSAGEVLPVLQSILAEGDDESKNQQSSSPSAGGGQSNFQGSVGGDYSGGGGSSSGGSKPDKLKAPEIDTAPIAVSVGNIRIIADKSSNQIVIIGPPEAKAKAISVLETLDQKPKQIYLATVIGELTLGKGSDMGVKYPGSVQVSFNTQNPGDPSVTASSAQTTAGNVSSAISAAGVDVVPGTSEMVNTALGLVNGVGIPFLSGLTLYGVLADSIDVYVSALESTNKFKIISRPVIYTANNKKAVISSGQQVPVPQSTLTSSLSTVQGASIASNIEYKDVVLKLEVIPLINSEHEVTLTIAQQNDNLRGNVVVGDNTVPIVGTQELTTTVTVPNRHTVVLGGLITEEETVDRSGLPFLSTIPIIGYVFGQKQKQKTRRELIIMIQPFIINNASDEAEVNYIETSMSGLNGQLYQDKLEVRRALPVDATVPVDKPPVNLRPLKGKLAPMGD